MTDQGLSRRRFLQGTAAVVTAAATVPLGGDWFAGVAGAAPSLTFTMVRREDMLRVLVRGFNLELRTGPARLARIDTTAPAYLTYELAPQHLLEEAFSNAGGPIPVPLRSRLAGPSRLGFELPTGLNSIPYSITSILDWNGLGLIPRPALTTHPTVAPDETRTAIEAPWGILLTPSDNTMGWAHAVRPVSLLGRTELWTARLGFRFGPFVIEPPLAFPQVKAVFRTAAGATNPIGLTALNAANRNDLVTNMTAGAAAPGAVVEYLSLSSLGATMNVVGNWNGPSGLTHWRNRAAQARDSFVRVVYKGFLLPDGIPASVITDTQREFRVAPNGEIVAYLVQREYVQVRQRDVNLPFAISDPAEQRRYPFTHIRMNTLVSPEVTRAPFGTFNPNTDAFWPQAGGQDVRWSRTATDHEGRLIELSGPMVFVYGIRVGTTQEIAYEPFVMAGARIFYEAEPVARRTVDLAGQRVAFTPSTQPGDTALPTGEIRLDVFSLTGNPDTFEAADTPAWIPTVADADVRLSAVEALQGSPLATPPTIAYHPTYVANGFGPSNAGEVFGEVVSALPRPDIPPQAAGGIASPDFDVTGLSRSLGPVGGDLSKLASGAPTFDPASFFNGLLPTLFGEISLLDLLPVKPLSLPADANRLPRITTELVYPGNDRTKAPQGARTHLEWRPAAQDLPNGFLKFLGDPATSFDLDATFSVPLADPTFPKTYDVAGELRTFTVTLLGDAAPFIALTFSKARFTAKTGAKPDLDIGLDKVEFVGPLTFVNQLKDFLGSAGKGPRVDVGESGIAVDYTLQLPTIAVGVFSLQNIALSAGLTLPFDGSPAFVEFAVCSRERPFLLTMGLFGGGGFFGLALSMQGLRQVEASIEFGAAVELNLGVASGGVHIFAGIYFRMTAKPTGNEIELTGYLRAGGSLEVLGIITISVEFYLGFTYLDPGKAYGKASLTVSVEVLFFSASVELTVERKIGGGNDPSFVDNVPTQALWNTYCDAFA
jgi:hypothetical protein